MKLFRRKNKSGFDGSPESRFEAVYELVKDLPKADFKRLMDGIELAWQGYDKALRVQTREEKENADIYSAEKELENGAKA